ncbi:MAG: 30S ribosomal protein S6 [Clostridia bacterium]|nr:30S ribosomal protein S6 [Clostridia bacterium]
MEKVINTYETLYIIDNRVDEAATKALVEKFTALISENGTIDSVEEWGKKKLAYPINDETEGYYVLVNFKSEPSFIAELERIFNITEGIVRSMTVRK